MTSHRPNVVFVFADQMRAAATGYAGDPNVRTPTLDKLAGESLNFTTAVSGCPVCTPARASLITGQYPHRHGILVNDIHLPPQPHAFGHAFRDAGYDTGYIGKWHLHGHGRSSYIPPEYHQGFDFWHVRECNHKYWDSFYFTNEPTKQWWPGYDAQAQTREAQQYIHDHADRDDPFALVLSWGPPHSPFHTAPQQYRDLYDPAAIELPPNVPEEIEGEARRALAGYYAHINALDDCLAELLGTLEQTGIAGNTIFVFWSDHGDMVGSHHAWNKQRPWDESIRVPLLIRYPNQLGHTGRAIDTPINTPDLLPTLLGLCEIDAPHAPHAYDGRNYAPYLRGEAPAPTDAALIASYAPFGQWHRANGGREFRGVRTRRYTYARSLVDGPWLLYDNDRDPYQLNNLIDDADHAALRDELEALMWTLLNEFDDTFEHGDHYIERFIRSRGYEVNETGTVPYTK